MATGSKVGAVLLSLVCVVDIVADVVRTEPSKNVIARMDHSRVPGKYRCGDRVANTVSGRVFSSIAAGEPALNCSLTLASPPGTQLSLTVLNINLAALHTDGSCAGNRLLMLAGDEQQGAPSLLPSLPHGLCGFAVPNTPVVSPDNEVTLLLETAQSVLERSFEIIYTAFKSNPDGECFECEIDSTREWPFCIHPSLVCDGVKNCPRFTEETNKNCESPSVPPPPSQTTALLIAGILIATVIVVIFFFLIFLVMAKRVYTKRNGSSARHHRSDMPMHQLSRRSGDFAPHDPADYQRAGPAGLGGADGAPHGMPMGPHMVVPGAPPAYSTLPRHKEQSLQMGEDTNPTSRPRSGNPENNLAAATPQSVQR